MTDVAKLPEGASGPLRSDEPKGLIAQGIVTLHELLKSSSEFPRFVVIVLIIVGLTAYWCKPENMWSIVSTAVVAIAAVFLHSVVLRQHKS
jgi:hypothetical protein